MTFSDLTPELQNIMLVNFEFFAKIIIIGGFFLLSIFLIYKFTTLKQTPYVLISIIRVISLAFSSIYLLFSPTYILLLYPQFPFENMIIWIFYFLLVITFIAFIFFMINLVYYSPIYILKKAGLNILLKGKNKTLNFLDNLLGYKNG